MGSIVYVSTQPRIQSSSPFHCTCGLGSCSHFWVGPGTSQAQEGAIQEETELEECEAHTAALSELHPTLHLTSKESF